MNDFKQAARSFCNPLPPFFSRLWNHYVTSAALPLYTHHSFRPEFLMLLKSHYYVLYAVKKKQIIFMNVYVFFFCADSCFMFQLASR